MDVSYFNYIIETAEEGSISKAAKKLYISQSYLSKIIQDVENKFNLTIFTRTNKGVRLTKEGRTFINYAKNILFEYKNIVDMRYLNLDKIKNLRVTTANSSLVTETFLKVVEKYDEKGKTNLKIKETDSAEVIRDIYYNDADIGIINIEPNEKRTILKDLEGKKISYKYLLSFGSYVVVGRNHELAERSVLTPEELKGYGLVRYSTESLPFSRYFPSPDYYNHFLELDNIDNVIEINNRGLLHDMLINTDYFSLGTMESKNQKDIFNIVSIPLKSDKVVNIETGIIWQQSKELNEIEIEFINILEEDYGDKEQV